MSLSRHFYIENDKNDRNFKKSTDVQLERFAVALEDCTGKPVAVPESWYISINEYVIDKAYDENLRNKIEAFRSETKTRKALQVTMITTYGVKKNMYSNRVQSQLTLDDLFLC